VATGFHISTRLRQGVPLLQLSVFDHGYPAFSRYRYCCFRQQLAGVCVQQPVTGIVRLSGFSEDVQTITQGFLRQGAR
jgi:hypothetical protein